jgi:cytochrome c
MKLLRLSIAAVLAASGWALSNEAGAQAGPQVLKAKGCLNCHDLEKKKVGPAFKDVAAKKAGKADELVAKLKEGKGHMKINATEAEIKAAVEQVLSTK